VGFADLERRHGRERGLDAPSFGFGRTVPHLIHGGLEETPAFRAR
jgi:hypothetical protein